MLQRKVQRVLSQPVEHGEVITALENLSSFYHENSLRNRQNLRSLLEKRSRGITKELINTCRFEFS